MWAYGERERRRGDLAVSTGWWAASLGQAKRIPPLKKLLKRTKGPRVVKPEQMTDWHRDVAAEVDAGSDALAALVNRPGGDRRG